MEKRTITIINKLGLHARAAAKLVNTSSLFNANITLAREDKEVDAKNIMSVLLLAASQGTELEISAEGDDALDAIVALEQLINDRFGEAE